jgi:hypothetical protein
MGKNVMSEEKVQEILNGFTDKEIAEYLRRKITNAFFSDDFEKQEEAKDFLIGIHQVKLIMNA